MKPVTLTTLSALLFCVASAFAQEDKAVLTGLITDSSQAGVPGAVVEVASAVNGFLRKATSNDAGSYTIGGLPVGVYDITVRKDGFQTAKFNSVQLVVGQIRTVNTQLQVLTSVQQMTVEDAAAPLAKSNADVGGVIVGREVANLPINGRNWTALLALVPGAIDSGGANQQTVRFAGRANDDNNFRFDGVDATGIQHQSQVNSVRLQISTEAIAEFRVDSLLYSAEKGGAPGGQAEVISKSGSNDFHGSAFEYIRNDRLDARTPFDPSTLPPLRLNQYGGTLGGPIIHNRTFFYAAYEGLRQRLGLTLIGFVPSDSFRARALATSPVLAPLLAAYPAGTSSVSADISQRTAPGRNTSDEDSGLIRIDHRFSDATSLFARYNIDSALQTAPSGNLLDIAQVPSYPMSGTVQLLHIFSPSMFNEAQLGFNRIKAKTVIDSRLFNVSHLNESLSVAGFSSLGQARQSVSTPTSYSALDNWNLTTGQHTIKAGVEVRRVLFNQDNAPSQSLSYISLDAFARNQLDTVNVASGIPMHGLDKTNYFGYVQDQWKARPELTLNIGLRYEYFSPFEEIYGRDRPFDPQTCGGYCKLGAQFWEPIYNGFEPRVGLAWSPRYLGGRSVIRAGWGLYQGEGQLSDLSNANENLQQRFTLNSLAFPGLSFPAESLFPLAVIQDSTPRAQQRRRQNPTVDQWGLQIQTSLFAGFILDTGYISSHGYHQFTRTFVNVIDPITGQRQFPGFGIIDSKDANDNSTFHGWQSSLQRQFRSGWLFTANYMWSHSINDGSVGGGEADYPQNVACRTCERASSDQDVRHSFSMNNVWELPFGKSRRYLNQGRVADLLAGGWSLSAIGIARSGLPVNVTLARPGASVPDGNNFSPQRPDLVAGVSVVPPSQTVGNWINAAAFSSPANGTIGNAGRNLVRGPSLWQADLGLTKRFRITERFSMDFRAEAFNVFNRAQFGNPNGNISSGSFGRITTTVNDGATGSGTPRQFQFALRVNY
ncbi:MAG: hypothetical protein JWO80_3869 [Bryobacterales bacterium]|nr:hypothetical protein [Bryobacterales bacterium]